MMMLLKLVFTFVYVAALCCAQTDDSFSSAARPTSREAQAPAVEASPNPPVQAPAPAPPVESPAVSQSPAGAAAPTVDQSLQSALPAGKPVAGSKPAEKGAETKKAYVIGPLDVLMIKVWNNVNLSGPANVGPDGMLSMPLIGEVKADGLTARQLKEAIAGRLTEFLNSPEVDVQVAKVNSKRYFVYGGVLRAGEFPLVQDTTIMDAMSLVGGFRDFANPKKIRIQRGAQEFNFNYRDVSKGKKMEQNILLQNGDRIFVPE
jgi:polysaccharide export outer membrane protein